MTLHEEIHALYQNCRIYYGCFNLLTPEEQCGLIWSQRYSNLSKISGVYGTEELLAEFRKYFEIRKSLILSVPERPTHEKH